MEPTCFAAVLGALQSVRTGENVQVSVATSFDRSHRSETQRGRVPDLLSHSLQEAEPGLRCTSSDSKCLVLSTIPQLSPGVPVDAFSVCEDGRPLPPLRPCVWPLSLQSGPLSHFSGREENSVLTAEELFLSRCQVYNSPYLTASPSLSGLS